MTETSPDDTKSSGFGRPPLAASIRKKFTEEQILAVRLVGAPGAGKTQLIEQTLKRLPWPGRAAVIAINPASKRDADQLAKSCGYVAHIDAAAPEAGPIWRIVSQWPLDQIDLLLIESAGGLGDLHDMGQDATAAIFSVSGGDDKAAEYAALIKRASAVVLTKVDLRSSVKFDDRVFRRDAQAINPLAVIHEVSSTSDEGMYAWLAWLEAQRIDKRTRLSGASAENYHEPFIG